MAQRDIATFEKALADATFISIDGYMFRVTVYDDGELHFEDEDSGEMHVSSIAELTADMGEIEIFTLTKSWTPEMMA